MVAIARVIGTSTSGERRRGGDEQLQGALPALPLQRDAAVVLTADHTPITLAPTAAR